MHLYDRRQPAAQRGTPVIRYKHLHHHFVQCLPADLAPGVLYISMEYATAAHRCCCGCGEEVVTPFTPTDWQITFDGETVSLWPSVGSWTLPCRSHYVIEGSRVLEAYPWSDRQIEAERIRNKTVKSLYYRMAESKDTPNARRQEEPSQQLPQGERHTRVDRLLAWLRR